MRPEDEIRELRQSLQFAKDQLRRIEERLDTAERRMRDREAAETLGKQAAAPPPPTETAAPEALKPPPLPPHPPVTPKPSFEAEKPAPEPQPAAHTAPRKPAPALKSGSESMRWLKNWLKSIGPEEGLSWEMALGTYWLPRIGLLVLAVGVVLLATLAVNRWGQEYMPHIRVAVGYGIGFGLLFIGRRLEKSAKNYAQLLLSGGFALCHFVTFAAHYIEYTRVIESVGVTYALLTAIVLAWGLYAHVRRSQLMALMVVLLAHLTVAVSTLTLPVVNNASVAALLMISAAAAFFMVNNRWYMVAALGMLGAYGNQFLWFYHSPPSTELSALLAALALISAYALIFALADFFAPEKLRREDVPLRLRALYATTNSGLFVGVGLILMRGFDASRDSTEYLYFGYAAAAVLLGTAYYKLRGKDPLCNAYFTKATVTVTLGLAALLDGAALNLALGIEALALLVAARRSQSPQSRLLIHATAIVTVAYGLYCIVEMPTYDYGDTAYIQQLLPALGSVVALLALSHFYLRTQWQAYLARGVVRREGLQKLLWLCDVTDAPPGQPASRAFDGLLWPVLYALGAAMLLTGYTFRLIDPMHQPALLGVAAALLAGLGILLRAKPFTSASLLAGFSAFLFWHAHIGLINGMLTRDAINLQTAALFSAILVASFWALSEMLRIFGGKREIWWQLPLKTGGKLDGQNALTYCCALGGVWLYAGAVLQLAPDERYALYLCIAPAVAGSYAVALGAPAIGLAAVVLAPFAACFASGAFWDGDMREIPALVSIGALALTALAGESRYVGARPGAYFHQTKFAPYMLYGIVAWLGYLYIATFMHGDGQLLWLVGVAAVALALVYVLHPRALALSATALLLGGALFWNSVMERFLSDSSHALWWHLNGVVLCALALAADRLFAHKKLWAHHIPGGLLVFMVWCVLQTHVHYGMDEWGYSGYGLMMIGFLLYGGYFRNTTAASLSLFGGILHSGTMILNNLDGGGETLPLLAGFAALTGYWLLLERLVAYAESSGRLDRHAKSPRMLADIFCYPPCIMLLAMGVCVTPLPLTIKWTLAAIAMMGLGYAFGQKHYRYAALATFALSIFRAFIIDTRNLEAVYRIASMIILGLVLLAVAYGYIYARNRQKPPPEDG